MKTVFMPILYGAILIVFRTAVSNFDQFHHFYFIFRKFCKNLHISISMNCYSILYEFYLASIYPWNYFWFIFIRPHSNLIVFTLLWPIRDDSTLCISLTLSFAYSWRIDFLDYFIYSLLSSLHGIK